MLLPMEIQEGLVTEICLLKHNSTFLSFILSVDGNVNVSTFIFPVSHVNSTPHLSVKVKHSKDGVKSF